MNDELIEEIEAIFKIDLNIKKAYNKLMTIDLLDGKIERFNEAKNDILTILKKLFDYENSTIDFLVDSDEAMDALNYLNNFDSIFITDDFRLCKNRLRNYLSNKLLKTALEIQDEEFIDDYLINEFITYITITRQFTKEEMIVLIENVLPKLNESLIKHFILTLNNDIKNETNYYNKKELLKLKYEFLLEKGKDVEISVLNNNLNASLNNDLSSINVDSSLKQELINFEVMNNLYNNVTILSSVTEKEIALEELIWFKTYILYIDENMLTTLKNYINDVNFQNNDVKLELIDNLNNVDKLKHMHNQDKKGYHK